MTHTETPFHGSAPSSLPFAIGLPVETTFSSLQAYTEQQRDDGLVGRNDCLGRRGRKPKPEPRMMKGERHRMRTS